MEVHAHSHTARKKWTHYFWEFLMLFLAVFCGFMAEYQLEHKIEKDREKQFIKSLVADLEEDQLIIQENIATNRTRLILMDRLINILSNPALIGKSGNDIYYMARLGPRIRTLINSSKTFDQLKNSGGFRLIRSNEASNHIMEYYNKIPQIKMLEEVFFDEFAHYKSIAAKLLDPIVMRSMEKANGDISREANNPALRNTNADLLKEFAVYIVYMNGTTRSIIPMEEDLLQNAGKLINYLKGKYHLK
jgi:hypothetical protein